jgi:hypothetical protein
MLPLMASRRHKSSTRPPSGTFCSLDHHKTLICSVLAQQPYAIEYLSAERTRDELPGAESFVMQTLKTVGKEGRKEVNFGGLGMLG